MIELDDPAWALSSGVVSGALRFPLLALRSRTRLLPEIVEISLERELTEKIVRARIKLYSDSSPRARVV